MEQTEGTREEARNGNNTGKAGNAFSDSIRPRQRRQAAKKVKRFRQSKQEKGPIIFWISMVSILALYLILLFGVRIRQRKHLEARLNPPGEIAAENNEVDAPHPTSLPDNINEQVLQLITQVQTVNKTLMAAEKFAGNGKLDTATEHLMAQVKEYPASISLKLALVNALLENGNRIEAIEHLVDILQVDDSNQAARLLLARSLLAEQAYESASLIAEWLIETDSYSVDAHDIAATAYMLNNKASLAVPHLRRIANLERNNVAVQNRLALAYMRMEQYEKATRLFQTIMEMDRNNSLTYYNLAVCYARQNRTEESIHILNEALNLFDPAFVNSWLQGSDFDNVRSDSVFTAFVEQVAQAHDTLKTD